MCGLLLWWPVAGLQVVGVEFRFLLVVRGMLVAWPTSLTNFVAIRRSWQTQRAHRNASSWRMESLKDEFEKLAELVPKRYTYPV